jgi:adenosylhomocysteinase
MAERGVPVFAWKGESLEEYWWSTVQALSFPGGKGPNLVVDDGGDATLIIHKGYAIEENPALLEEKGSNREEQIILDTLRKVYDEDPEKWHRLVKEWKGVSEETTTGVHRLYQLKDRGELLVPAINVNDSVTSRNLITCMVAASHWPTASKGLRISCWPARWWWYAATEMWGKDQPSRCATSAHG